jgi:hypothetical protein
MPRPVCFLGSVQESEQLIDSWGFRVASFSVRSADERERMDKDSGWPGYRVYIVVALVIRRAFVPPKSCMAKILG